MSNELNCVVRMENNKPIIFMRGEDSTIMVDCFTFQDGHNEATTTYMRSLPLANEDITIKTLKAYQSHLDSLPIDHISVQEKKRLKLK